MKIEVFRSCCGGGELTQLVRRVVHERGLDADVVEISDFKESISRGIVSTPAVAVNGKVVIAGRTPTYEALVKHLK